MSRFVRKSALKVEHLEDRLTPTLGFDPTFGSGGQALIGSDLFFNHNHRLISTLPDGDVVVATALKLDGEYNKGVLKRLNSDGSLNTAFGENGTVNLADQFWLLDQVVRPDGKIVVLGTGYENMFSGGYTTDVYQFNADGSSDASFGTNGLLRSNASSLDPCAFTKMTLVGDGSVLVTTGSAGGFQVTKVLADGTLDATFGVCGVATIAMPFDSSSTTLAAVSTTPGGDILIAGGCLASQVDTAADETIRVVVRLSSNGQPDPNWGTNGVLNLATLGWTEPGGGLQSRPIGDMLVTASGVLLRFPDSIMKVTNGGEIDPTFGASGWLATESKFSILHTDHGTLMAELSDGRIVFTGEMAASDPYDFIATVTVASATGVVEQVFSFPAEVTVDALTSPTYTRIVDLLVSGSDQVVVVFQANTLNSPLDYEVRIATLVDDATVPPPPVLEDFPVVVVDPIEFLNHVLIRVPGVEAQSGVTFGASQQVATPGDLTGDGVVDVVRVTKTNRITIIDGGHAESAGFGLPTLRRRLRRRVVLGDRRPRRGRPRRHCGVCPSGRECPRDRVATEFDRGRADARSCHHLYRGRGRELSGRRSRRHRQLHGFRGATCRERRARRRTACDGVRRAVASRGGSDRSR